jgi:hypothetical protein
MRRMRFRLRTQIIAVAAAAVLIAALVGIWKSAESRRLAQLAANYRECAYRYSDMARAAQQRETIDLQGLAHQESLANVFQQAANGWRSTGVLAAASKSQQDAFAAAESAAAYRKDAAIAKREVQFYTTLRVKYEAAAAQPWIPIEPDPEFVER